MADVPVTDVTQTQAFAAVFHRVKRLVDERCPCPTGGGATGTVLSPRRRVLVALDGRCGAGKSTLAAALCAALESAYSESGLSPCCALLHMDDFFLRPEQRTPLRLSTPGGNVDYERFLSEVLSPLRAGEPAVYRPFRCKTMSLDEGTVVDPARIVLVEGSYACHPTLRELYDLRVFLDIDPAAQWARIRRRNGAGAEAFRDRWIPLEEAYFQSCGVRAACDCVVNPE